MGLITVAHFCNPGGGKKLMGWRSAWATYKALGQARLHSETLPPKAPRKYNVDSTVVAGVHD